MALSMERLPCAIATFSLCSTPIGALNELLSLSLFADLQRSYSARYTVPHLASSSEITCSLALLEAVLLQQGMKKEDCFLPYQLPIFIPGISYLFAPYMPLFPSLMAFTSAWVATGIYTLLKLKANSD